MQAATRVARTMESQPDVARLLHRAKGVFIVPHYGRGAIGLGRSGGAGVLVAREHGHWGNPIFYKIGSVSLGTQIGASAGPIAMILMTTQAVDHFKQTNAFSVNANAGLTVVNYSARRQASTRGDVVLWSHTKGAFVGASIQASAIRADNGENRAYYDSPAARPASILNGNVAVARPSATRLRRAIG